MNPLLVFLANPFPHVFFFFVHLSFTRPLNHCRTFCNNQIASPGETITISNLTTVHVQLFFQIIQGIIVYVFYLVFPCEYLVT